MRVALFLVIPALVLVTTARAEEVPFEIDYLLTTVGSSDCVFIRNGKRHSAADAEDHLRMKYRRGKRYVDTAEDFIDRLATGSSWTGRAYSVRCGEHEQTSAAWLHQALADRREGVSGS